MACWGKTVWKINSGTTQCANPDPRFIKILSKHKVNILQTVHQDWSKCEHTRMFSFLTNPFKEKEMLQAWPQKNCIVGSTRKQQENDASCLNRNDSDETKIFCTNISVTSSCETPL